jgi:hypothetical protein
VPPIEKKIINSEHYQTSNINSESIKRNLLFTSAKYKPTSQEKLDTFPHTLKVIGKFNEQNGKLSLNRNYKINNKKQLKS